MPESEPQAATALDVAHEVTGLVLAVLKVSQSIGGGTASGHLRTIGEDQKVIEAETRLAVAMESWLGEGMTFTAAETVRELGSLLGPVHDRLHEED